ncbi:hypothetical protein LY76DRAFT_597754 [Colletotrichum caudatum]|nr:hypothetical protein LY76DRAFT_597754 [Colletotrichum caudatum]
MAAQILQKRGLLKHVDGAQIIQGRPPRSAGSTRPSTAVIKLGSLPICLPESGSSELAPSRKILPGQPSQARHLGPSGRSSFSDIIPAFPQTMRRSVG